MGKYQVLIDWKLRDRIFDTEEDAEEYALYMCNCIREDAENKSLSDPEEYPFEEIPEPEYEIVKFK